MPDVIAILLQTTPYRIMAMLHILAAIIAFGPLFLYPQLRKAGETRAMAATHMRLTFPALIVLWVVGMGLAGMSEESSHGSVVAHIFADGSFGEIARERVAMLPDVLITLAMTQWAAAFAMFLLGMVLAREGILARPLPRNRRLERRWSRFPRTLLCRPSQVVPQRLLASRRSTRGGEYLEVHSEVYRIRYKKEEGRK